MSVSDHSRHARLSRLDPINWPPGTAIVLFIAWAAFALVSTVWLRPLLWTVLPIGLTLYLYAERYPWRVNLTFVAPLALLDGARAGRRLDRFADGGRLRDLPDRLRLLLRRDVRSRSRSVDRTPARDGSSGRVSRPVWHGSVSRTRWSRPTPRSVRSTPTTTRRAARDAGPTRDAGKA